MFSWSRMLPDYTVMRWDETTFDVRSNPFTAAAYEAKKYAFVADYVRLYALKKYGGIYLDTDVEIIKPLDDLLCYESLSGFETDSIIQTGLIAFSKSNIILEEFFDVYKNLEFCLDLQSEKCIKPNSAYLADILSKHGLRLDNSRQNICGVEVFPQEYFCPINQATREQEVTDNTYCIHYLSGSWFGKRNRIVNTLKCVVGSIFGYEFVARIRKIVVRG